CCKRRRDKDWPHPTRHQQQYGYQKYVTEPERPVRLRTYGQHAAKFCCAVGQDGHEAHQDHRVPRRIQIRYAPRGTIRFLFHRQTPMSENWKSQVNLVSNQQVLAIVTAWNHRLAARFVSTIFFVGQLMEALEAIGADIRLSEPPHENRCRYAPGKAQHPQGASAEKWQGTFSTQSDDTQRPVQTRVRARCSMSVHHPNQDMTRSLYRR